jgi:uncharacterized protein (TIGR03435 family)
VDLTDLKGTYDIDIAWVPEGSDAVGGQGRALAITSSGDGTRTASERVVDMPTGTIFQVLQEKLGLRLEARRIPIEMIVVDHAEKIPTEN